jgi:hypothetical protein
MKLVTCTYTNKFFGTVIVDLRKQLDIWNEQSPLFFQRGLKDDLASATSTKPKTSDLLRRIKLILSEVVENDVMQEGWKIVIVGGRKFGHIKEDVSSQLEQEGMEVSWKEMHYRSSKPNESNDHGRSKDPFDRTAVICVGVKKV